MGIERNRDKARARASAWQRTHSEQYKYNQWCASLRRDYGITVEQYNQMFTQQNGCCAGCGVPQSELKKKLCVDHDHITGKVRGLLCDHCNKALGFVNDDKTTLKNLLSYLINSKEI